MAHENNISSINTHRGISPKIHVIRSNRPASPRFNPTAPPFIRKASTEDNFTCPGVVVEPSIKHDPVGYVQHELYSHSYGKPSHDPMKQHDRGREYMMSHWHNPNPLSGTLRLPPPSMGGAPPLSSAVSSSSRSSRSSTTIQYSPPCRPYHNAVTPSPPVHVQMQVQGGDYYEAKKKLEMEELLSKKAEAFDTRLGYLQNLKKKLLAAFKEHSKKTVVELDLTTTCYSDDDHLLPTSWQMTGLYRRADGDASNSNTEEKLRDEFGQGVKNVEEEIEEMWGDFKVPSEARPEEEVRFLELEG